MADAHRHGSSYVVEVGGDHVMFDCGPATTHKAVPAGAIRDITRHYDGEVIRGRDMMVIEH